MELGKEGVAKIGTESFKTFTLGTENLFLGSSKFSRDY
jgi:hypothetical protein